MSALCIFFFRAIGASKSTRLGKTKTENVIIVIRQLCCFLEIAQPELAFSHPEIEVGVQDPVEHGETFFVEGERFPPLLLQRAPHLYARGAGISFQRGRPKDRRDKLTYVAASRATAQRQKLYLRYFSASQRSLARFVFLINTATIGALPVTPSSYTHWPFFGAAKPLTHPLSR